MIKHYNSNFYKNPLYQSLYSMNKNVLIDENTNSITNLNTNITNNKENFKKYNKINDIKNKNKIYKRHGNQSLITYLKEFNQFINHTNRLFLYKARISPSKTNSLSFNLSNSRKKFLKLEKSSLENQLNSKIMGKINGLINNLEMKNELIKKENEKEDNIII